MPDTLLIIAEDQAHTAPLLRQLQKVHPCDTQVCRNLDAARQRLANGAQSCRLAIIDVDREHNGVLQEIADFRQEYPEVRLVSLIHPGMMRAAAEALRAGADDFLTFPPSESRLHALLNGAARRIQPPAASPLPFPPPPRAGTLSLLSPQGELRSLQELEREIIRFALHHLGGHMSETARKLGIGRSTLYRKVDEMDISTQSIANS